MPLVFRKVSGVSTTSHSSLSLKMRSETEKTYSLFIFQILIFDYLSNRCLSDPLFDWYWLSDIKIKWNDRNENGVNKTINWKLKSIFEMRMARTSRPAHTHIIRTNQWLMSSSISISLFFRVLYVMNAIERMTSLCRNDAASTFS